MNTIWKFPLQVTDEQWVLLPRGADILTVQDQYGSLYLWALVDPKAPLKRRCVRIVGTGHPAPAGDRYLGSVQQHGGDLVWHVFAAETPGARD